MERLVGSEQLLYGSDRPVVDPDCHGIREALDWERLASNADRLFAHSSQGRSARETQSPGWSARGSRSSIHRDDGRSADRRPTRSARPAAAPRPKRVAVLGEGGSMSGDLSYVRRLRGRNLCGPELETFVGDLANSRSFGSTWSSTTVPSATTRRCSATST